MCLCPTEKGLKKYDGKTGIFKFYKIFDDIIINNKRIIKSPFQDHIITRSGKINLPKNSTLDLYFYNNNSEIHITGGCFHGFSNFKSAKKMTNRSYFLMNKVIILPIYVKGDDIVAADSTSGVCFFSYEIKKEDWDKALKINKKIR